MVRRTSNPGYVLAYHGLDRELGEKILTGKQGLVPSENGYDWLVHGIYFWEEDYNRAAEWAYKRQSALRYTHQTQHRPTNIAIV